MRSTLWIFVLILMTGYDVMSQCAPSVTPDLTCSGTPLQNNVNINSGTRYYVGSAGGTFSGINLAGGTLIICGKVTFNGLNFNGGQLIINAGAEVTFNSNFNTGNNHQFYNYGKAVFNTAINVGGLFYNHITGVIVVNGSTSHLNNVNFINNGDITFGDVTFNGGAEICLGPGSSMNTRSIFTNPKDVIKVPKGPACIGYATTFGGNNAVTASSGLRICQKPGATDPTPKVIGTAIVNKNCSTCEPPQPGSLPLKLTSFTGNRKGELAELVWVTSFEEQVRSFVIEQSTDGKEYAAVKEIAAQNRPSSYRTTVPLASNLFFRLKMIDIDGTTTYSPIIRVMQLTGSFELALASNPVRGSNSTVRLTSQQPQQGSLVLLDNSGRVLRRQQLNVQKGDTQVDLQVGGLVNGQYFLYFEGSKDRSKTIPLLKL